MRTGDRHSVVLLEGVEDSPDYYKLVYGAGTGGGDSNSPRHRHTCDQVRMILDGTYSFSLNRTMDVGTVGYFPESVYYGPQSFSDNIAWLVLQFGGPSGLGMFSTRQRKKAIEELSAKGGTFDNGLYVWTDENGERHNQDAFEAATEQWCGHKLEYPGARYDDVVLMHPENFTWMSDSDVPGLSRKLLGIFTERHLRVEFMHLEPDVEFVFGKEPSNEMLFILEGALSRGGVVHERLSAFGAAASDSPETLQATQQTELLYVKLPSF
jgi:hypothetical protein